MTDLILASAARSVQARRRIAGHIYQTPLLPARAPGLWFKAENFQLTGSFKIRGAASVMTALPRAGHGILWQPRHWGGPGGAVAWCQADRCPA